jgi:hypothetical protein
MSTASMVGSSRRAVLGRRGAGRVSYLVLVMRGRGRVEEQRLLRDLISNYNRINANLDTSTAHSESHASSRTPEFFEITCRDRHDDDSRMRFGRRDDCVGPVSRVSAQSSWLMWRGGGEGVGVRDPRRAEEPDLDGVGVLGRRGRVVGCPVAAAETDEGCHL